MTRRTAFRRPSRRTLLVAATVTAVGAPALASAGALAASSGSSAAPAATCVGQALPTLGGPYGTAIAAATNGDVAGIASNSSGASQAVLWHAGKVQQIRTGLAESVPAGINAHGDVVGNAPNGENTAGWAWSGNRTVRLHGTGELTALPAAISNGGVIVGALETTEGTPSEGDSKPGTPENEQAAVWRSSTGPPQILAPLPGDQGAHAYAVGSDGRIGGVSEGAVFRPVVWDQAGKPHELPGLGGGYGIVRAFGPGGIAVGDVVAKDGTDHAVRWDASGRITDLGLPQGSRTAQATGVLPGGAVVGTAQVPAPGGGMVTQAMRWPAAGNPQPLTGQQSTAVTDVAPAQAAVGYRADAKGGRHPMIWRCGA
jgi:YD repeat-containing protein